jgi:hypothetical protein
MSAIEREQRRPRCGEDSRARGLHSRLRSGLCYRPLGYEREPDFLVEDGAPRAGTR